MPSCVTGDSGSEWKEREQGEGRGQIGEEGPEGHSTPQRGTHIDPKRWTSTEKEIREDGRKPSQAGHSVPPTDRTGRGQDPRSLTTLTNWIPRPLTRPSPRSPAGSPISSSSEVIDLERREMAGGGSRLACWGAERGGDVGTVSTVRRPMTSAPPYSRSPLRGQCCQRAEPSLPQKQAALG